MSETLIAKAKSWLNHGTVDEDPSSIVEGLIDEIARLHAHIEEASAKTLTLLEDAGFRETTAVRRADEAEAEVARLRAIVATLPILADGVLLTSDVRIWANMREYDVPQYLGGGGHVSGGYYYWCSKAVPISDCYSTQEAANEDRAR